jgi:hypothetical protein
MSSVLSSYSQRDNNVTNVTPVTITSGNGWDGYQQLDIDPRYCQMFNVDVSLADTSTETITSRLSAYGTIVTVTVPVAYFVVTIDPKYAALYPGREITLNFNRNGVSYTLCVDVYPTANVSANIINVTGCDLLSPPAGFDNRETQTLKLKSNGTSFVPISSGPVTWSSAWDC